MPDTTPGSTPTAPATRRPSPYLIGAGVVVIILGFGLPQFLSDAPAAPAASADGTPAPTPANLGVALLRLAAGLVVVCALCVVATRYANRKRPQQPAGTMQILATLPLGPRCVVHLVRVGERRLLVGTDLGGVKSVVELPGATPEPEADTTTEPGAIAEPAPAVVIGPVAMPAPAPAPPSATQEAILALLTRLQTRSQAPPSSPG